MTDFDPITMAWRMTAMSGRLMARGVKAGATVTRHASFAASARGARTPVRTGVVMPGDRTPGPQAGGYLDYRGAASLPDVAALDATRLGPAFGIGRLVTDRRGPRNPVALPPEVLTRHAAVIGPTGAGKTRGVILPWIYAALAAGDTVVAVDVKGDLLDDFQGYAARRGPLGVPIGKWDLTDPARSLRWNWMAELTDDGSLDAAVTAILGRGHPGTDPYFHQRDSALLKGVLSAAPAVFRHAPSTSDVLAMLSDGDWMRGFVAGSPSAPGADLLDPIVRDLDPADYGKVTSGVRTALRRIAGPRMAAVTTAAAGGLSMGPLLDSGALLVVAAPLREGDASRMASALALNLIIQRLYSRFGRPGRRVFLVVDEAPQIVGRVEFEQLLATARSAGVSVVLAAQDTAQFKDENERSAIFANCATLITLAGVSAKTTELLQHRLGQLVVPVVTASRTAQFHGNSVNYATQTVPVLGFSEISRPPFGPRCGVVHVTAPEYGITGKPVLVELTDN